MVDAASYSDIGLEVNGLDAESDAWAYLAMAPSDESVYAYAGHTRYDSAEQTYTLLPSTGLPATHELPLSRDGSQITFYVDGQPRKSLPTKQSGQWVRLLFDVDARASVSGSFDDVRITYAEQLAAGGRARQTHVSDVPIRACVQNEAMALLYAFPNSLLQELDYRSILR